jgi:hypothetical protein
MRKNNTLSKFSFGREEENMRKISLSLCLLLIVSIFLSACGTPSGIMLKDALVKQSVLDSYESKTSISLDVNSSVEQQLFEVELYTKVLDAMNLEYHLSANDAILDLLGIEKPVDQKEQPTLKALVKEGEIVLTSNQDKAGISFGNVFEILEGSTGEELTEAEKEELKNLHKNLRKAFQELLTNYLKEYKFPLSKIQNKGIAYVELPNGTQVSTTHIQVELTIPEVANMVEYSLQHLLNNEELQQSVIDFVIAMASSQNLTLEELSDEELKEMEEEIKQSMKEDLPKAIEEIQEFEKELANDEMKPVVENVQLFVDTYIGGQDKEVYQQDFSVLATYTSELEEQGVDGEGVSAEMPFEMKDGDTVEFKVSNKIWNHNKKLSPVELPETLFTIEDLEVMDGIEDFREVSGENSLLAQIFEQFENTFGGSDFDEELYYLDIELDGNKALISTPQLDPQEVSVYSTKDGRLMVPLAFTISNMGGEITWDGKSKKVNAIIDDYVIQVNYKKNFEVTIDGEVYPEIKVESKNGYSYVDIVALSESLGWYVDQEEPGFIFIVK